MLFFFFFFFAVWSFTDHPSIMESPANVTVNESEITTFTCAATGADNFTIEWDVGGVLYNNETCMSPKCESINSESSNGLLTSTLTVNGMTSLDVTCVINHYPNQTLMVSSEEHGIDSEIRLPSTRSIRTSTVYFGKPELNSTRNSSP